MRDCLVSLLGIAAPLELPCHLEHIMSLNARSYIWFMVTCVGRFFREPGIGIPRSFSPRRVGTCGSALWLCESELSGKP